MGGKGSGMYYRWSTRETVEDYRFIDVRRWSREGYFDGHHVFNWQWTRDGEQVALINAESFPDRVILKYRCRVDDGDWESIRTEIELDRTPCHFGGSRAWFLCPFCCGRVAKLYGGKYFWCRDCHRLPYRSQSETDLDRALRKANKYFDRIRSDKDGFYEWLEKPKGMHWKTFWRLYDQGMAEMEKARVLAMNSWGVEGLWAFSDAMPCTPYEYGSPGRIGR